MKITGWNPFIPLDDKNSGIPCALLEYTLRNTSSQSVDYEFAYHLSHLAPGCKPDQSASVNAAIPGKGVFFSNREEANAEVVRKRGPDRDRCHPERPGRIKAMWLRSPGWEFDSLSALWREVADGTFTANEGSNSVDTAGRNGGSILLEGSLAPGASRTHIIVITGIFPIATFTKG